MVLCTKLLESGYEQALLGISLNKEQDPIRMVSVSEKLSKAPQGSHRKFLRQICLWWDITLPRKIWTEFDTYRIGVTRNSGSTMHNLQKRPYNASDFDSGTDPRTIALLVELWQDHMDGRLSLTDFKSNIPEGLLQRSVITMNYEVLRSMILDRATHRLPEWPALLSMMLAQVEHPELLPSVKISTP